jgi:hypothetical protein
MNSDASAKAKAAEEDGRRSPESRMVSLRGLLGIKVPMVRVMEARESFERGGM